MHFRVAFAGIVLGRTWRVNNRRIDDRAGVHFDLEARQLMIYFIQHREAELVLFKEMTEFADRRLIGRRRIA